MILRIPLLLLALILQTTAHANIMVNQEGHTVIPLAELMTEDRDVILQGFSESHTFNHQFTFILPLSERVQINEATLELIYTNSIALSRQRSQINVRVNDTILAQSALGGTNSEGKMVIRLPLQLLSSGFNRLTIETIHHNLEQCEDPTAPELWSQINTTESRLILDATYRTVTPKLGEMADLIDRKLWGDYPLSILNPEPTVSAEFLSWGSAISQGAAILMDYKQPQLRYSPALPYIPAAEDARVETRRRNEQWRFPGLDQQPLQQQDAVLVGTREQLLPFLSPAIIEQINGSFLGVYAQDNDPTRFILVISGRDNDEVTMATQAFSYGYTGLPNRASTLINNVQIPEELYSPELNQVHPEKSYSFKQLGVRSVGLNAANAAPVQLKIWRPADIYSPQDQEIKMRFHLAYGAGFGPMSVLNIMINGKYQGVIRLSDPEGGIYHDYQILIPVTALLPSTNIIEFIPSLEPLKRSSECERDYLGGLRLSLYEDSTLEMPPAYRIAALPDLQTFSQTGFPYTNNGHSRAGYVELANTDPGTISAAWTVIAKLTQQLRAPLNGLQIGAFPTTQPRHTLLFGTEQQLRDRYADQTPRVVQTLLHTPDISDSLLPRTLEGRGYIDGWINNLMTRITPLTQPEGPFSIFNELVSFTDSHQHLSTIAQYESPQHPGYVMTAITARSSDELAQWGNRLTTGAVWANLRGDLAEWRDGDKLPKSYLVGSPFQVGAIEIRPVISHYLSLYPFYFIGLLLILVIMFGWFTRRLLNKNQTK